MPTPVRGSLIGLCLILSVVMLGQETTPAAPPAPEPLWLRDAQGREYYLEKVLKTQAQRLGRDSVTTVWGIAIQVVKEDEAFYYYKFYKPRKETGPVVRPEGMSNDEAAAQAELYRSDVPWSHRLSFVPFDLGLPQQGQWRDGFGIGDMNEDGALDLVFGPPRKSFGGPVIFLGDGRGKWTRWKDAHFPNLPYDYGTAAVGDLDGDGHLDIVFGVHLRGLIALRGDGKGNFVDDSKGLEFAVPGRDPTVAFSSRALAIADWDGDGRPDIIALGEGPRLDMTSEKKGLRLGATGLVVYLNQKEGGWKRLDLVKSATYTFGESLALIDVNHDCRLDVVTGSNTMGQRAIVHLSDANHLTTGQEVDALRADALVRSVAAADFNGDGRMDLAVAYATFTRGQWRSGVDVLYQVADGRWTRETLASVVGLNGPTVVATGDLDGDGHPDVVAATADGEIWPFLSGHGVPFSREATLTPSFGKCSANAVQLRDLNGDHLDEIVVSFATEDESEEGRKCASQGGVAIWSPRPSKSGATDSQQRIDLDKNNMN